MNITIASMSPTGSIDINVLNAARSAKAVILQTDLDGTVNLNDIEYKTLDNLYMEAEDFDDLIKRACDEIIQDDTLFIVLGNGYQNEIAVRAAHQVRQQGGNVSVMPHGEPALCSALESGILSALTGHSVFSAASFSRITDTDNIVVISEIDTRVKASEIKLKLAQYYGDEYNVLLADVREIAAKKIPLCTIDSEASYGYYTSVVLPPLPLKEKARYTFRDLVSVMDRLRSQNGCPWDKEQTHESLKRYLVEESYEVLEAIDDEDMDALYDELGDVLLQVVFHAKIAQQCGEFDITDITTAICKKMISRHTHIFGSASADTPDDVVQNWEQIKKKEKGQSTQTEVLKNVPKSMPALMRSGKVQHKAAHIGFDFRDVSEAMDKLREEIIEVEEDIKNGNDLAEECGDLLFAAVNVVRMLKVEPEIALQNATDKFIDRFTHVEQIAVSHGIDMQNCDIEQLDAIWDEAKQKTRKFKDKY